MAEILLRECMAWLGFTDPLPFGDLLCQEPPHNSIRPGWLRILREYPRGRFVWVRDKAGCAGAQAANEELRRQVQAAAADRDKLCRQLRQLGGLADAAEGELAALRDAVGAAKQQAQKLQDLLGGYHRRAHDAAARQEKLLGRTGKTFSSTHSLSEQCTWSARPEAAAATVHCETPMMAAMGTYGVAPVSRAP